MSKVWWAAVSRFYVVSSDILPEVLEKVMQAQILLQTGEASRISEAVKQVGISRGTFYKYKDAVFAFNEEANRRKAILSLVVQDVKGILSRILGVIAASNVNVLAINQTIPLNHISNVSLTLDITDLDEGVESLIRRLEEMEGVRKAALVAVE